MSTFLAEASLEIKMSFQILDSQEWTFTLRALMFNDSALSVLRANVVLKIYFSYICLWAAMAREQFSRI